MPTNLQTPEGWTPGTTLEQDLPFTLNGAPVVNPPSFVKGYSVRRFNTPEDYTFRLDTEHILPADPNTTLRYDNTNYSLAFISIHRSLRYRQITFRDRTPSWTQEMERESVLNNRPQLSIVFLSATNSIFHINVPIEVVNSSVDENLFLNSWLYVNGTKKFPSAYTLNQILQVQSANRTSAQTRTIDYGELEHNKGKKIPYVLCQFQDPVKVNKQRMPAWFKEDETMSQENPEPTDTQTFKSWRPKTFDAILNIMLDAIFSVEKTKKDSAGNDVKRWYSSQETYFNIGPFPSTLTPSYNQFDLSKLLGKAFVQPLTLGQGQKPLKNVKCYPINLNTDVDDEGQIVIDSEKKPVSVKSISDLDEPNAADKEARTQTFNTILWYVLFVVIGLLVLLLLIVGIVLLFTGNVRKQALAKATETLAASQVAAAKVSFPPRQVSTG